MSHIKDEQVCKTWLLLQCDKKLAVKKIRLVLNTSIKANTYYAISSNYYSLHSLTAEKVCYSNLYIVCLNYNWQHWHTENILSELKLTMDLYDHQVS